jgi:hypothetical protein
MVSLIPSTARQAFKRKRTAGFTISESGSVKRADLLGSLTVEIPKPKILED